MNYFRIRLLVVFIELAGFSFALSGQNNNDQQAHKTLFIIVDGIPEDVIHDVKTPNLDEIARAGGFLPAYVGGGAGTYSETPTISAVGYNSLLTGTWANKHNVWGNGIVNPNYHYWSVFRLFKEQYPAKKIAVFSTWLDNRTKLIGAGLDATGQLRMNYFFDGLEHDTLTFPHDRARNYIHDIDEKVVDDAQEYILNEAPDLSWIYLEYTDDMGHQFGDHPRFHKAIETMDDQMGRIWKAVEEREKNFNEEWLVIITTDHGRTADTGKDHGGQSERERNTWIVTNAKEINEYGQKNRLGIVDILPSITKYMSISIPRYRAMELDGASFLGKTDVAQLSAKKSGSQIDLKWSAHLKRGQVRIWLTTTNKFQYGGEDLYLLLGEVEVDEEEAKFSVREIPSDFYKIVLETPDQYCNTWITE